MPKQKPEPPKRRYGPTEIHNEEMRAQAVEGLSKLWDAMDLSSGHFGVGGQMYYQLYCYIGEMLLGEDCPEKEVLT